LGKAEDHQLGWAQSVMWKANTYKVVAPACVDEGLMGWPPRASIERTDQMLKIWD
jgi:hypothetical protein